ncbi:MAG: CHAT domain-containing protein [Bacteroidetes bacterium]|nr:MAG: CHAT domain-containing protein [Bacteroidota bacterium]
MSYYDKALALRLQLLGREHPQVADTYHNMGNVYYYLGQLDKARTYYERAYQIWRAAYGPVHARIAYSYLSFGIIAAVKGDNRKALDYFERERAIKQQVYGPHHPDLAWSYNNLGLIYIRQKKYQEALQAHEQAREILAYSFGQRHPYLAQAHYNMADVYRAMGNETARLHQLQLACIAAHEWFEQEEVDANPPAEGVLDEREMLRILHQKGQSLLSLAALEPQHARQRLQQALGSFEAAAELIDYSLKSYKAESSKRFLQQLATPVYEGGIQCLFSMYQQQHDPALLQKAFTFFEKNKAFLLLSAWQASQAAQYAGLPDSLRQREQSMREALLFARARTTAETDSSRLIELRASLFDLEQQYESFVKKLEDEYPRYAELKYPRPTLRVEEVRQQLLKGQASLLEYFVGDSNVYALLINPSDAGLYHLGPSEGLRRQVQQMRNSIYTPFLTPETTDSAYRQFAATYTTHAHGLYRMLIAPLQQQLQQQVLLIPDGELGYLPFEALLTDLPQQATTFKSHPYLLHRHRFAYNYSASLLARLMRPPPASSSPSRKWLAVAPSFEEEAQTNAYASVEAFRRANMGPLRFNVQEVEGIKATFGGEVLRDERAAKQQFLALAPHFRYLHLATHGKMNDTRPAYSFLAFTPVGDSLRDKLYLHELYGLRLQADMVVLSACETGIGQLHKGEGIASLARGFFYAGARSLVTTLWSVNDAQTASLMQAFYHHLQQKRPKDAALQQAKLDQLEKSDDFHAHPYFWAGTIVMGNVQPLSQSAFPWYWLLAGMAALLLLAWLKWR